MGKQVKELILTDKGRDKENYKNKVQSVMEFALSLARVKAVIPMELTLTIMIAVNVEARVTQKVAVTAKVDAKKRLKVASL